MVASTSWRTLTLVCTFDPVLRAAAHSHHADLPEGHYVSDDPIDATLWAHIWLQIVAWGIVFPTGMVLGVVRSRWHVPLQTTGAVLAVLAYALGHLHGGRSFATNAHAAFATPVMLVLISQLCFGTYLKLHWEQGIHGRMRRIVAPVHGVVGKALPVVAWIQMVFGGITALGFCRDDHRGQCLAHLIMGSAFVAYGIIYTNLLLAGQLWLRRTGRSQEFFDSIVIAAWGCVSTFTEHRWGGPWANNDLQQTAMGILWWCAGLLGVWLSGTRNGRPQRNLIPALVIVLTGFAMSEHPQSTELGTQIHTVSGYTLMGAGLARIVEISFVLRDRAVANDRHMLEPSSFQYLPTFLLYASGFLFMGATEEQMQLLSDLHVTHVPYVLLLFSVSFVLFLFVNVLLHVYVSHAWPSDTAVPASAAAPPDDRRHALTSERAHLRDAEEFELEGLMSGEDGDASTPARKDERSRRPA